MERSHVTRIGCRGWRRLSDTPGLPLPVVAGWPGELLPLHIFEPRYRELVARCLAGPPSVLRRDRGRRGGHPAKSRLPGAVTDGAERTLPTPHFNMSWKRGEPACGSGRSTDPRPTAI